MIFEIGFFLTIASYQFSKNDRISINYDLFFGKNILYKFSV